MAKFNLLAASTLAMSALAHPTSKYIGSERRFCAHEESSAIFAHSELMSRATIPKATTWDPPSSMVTALDQVWQQTLKEMPDGLKDRNWITDQLIANNGSMNYCVRWNTDVHNSTAADRTKITAALQRSLQKWFDVLVGFEGFPLTQLTVNTVGYAVKDKRIIQGSTTGLDIYTTADADGFPECDTRCYRGAHLDDPNGIGLCPGGEESRYDISLWLDSSLEGRLGGYGSSWGQMLGPDYMLNNLDTDNIHILLHEMGHGFGLLDFYDWVPSGQTSFIMRAGSAMEITEFDAWMLRDWYRKLKAVRGW